jgi:AcrR family transcriptional regulator
VALDAFVEQGIGAPLDEIARRAGVGIGTLYRHFPTREALVDALIRDGVDELCHKGDELAGSADPMDALAAWLRALVDHAARFRGLAASIVAAGCGTDHDQALADSCARVNGAGGALMARAREAGQLRPDVDDADIIDLAASIAWITDHAPRDEGQTDRLLGLVLDAITTHPSAAGAAPPADRSSAPE